MEEKQCSGCGHQNDCQKIYEQLGNAKGPSILSGTLLVLLGPLVIFIAVAAACEKLLGDVTASQPITVLLSILSGIIVVTAYIVIVKMCLPNSHRHN